MIKFHYLKFFKYIVVLLVIYNIIALLVLFLPNKKLKYNIWRLTPYDYSYLTGYPNFLENLSILNSTNREEIKEYININISKNIFDVDFWNYKLIIDNYSKDKKNDFEKTFLNLFFLTKNNKSKQLDLKKYFVSNYKFFSEKSKNVILKNFN